MSIVGDFASLLYTKEHKQESRPLTPCNYPAKSEKLFEIKAVIFDVYGTLLQYWRPGFSDKDEKEVLLLTAFKKTADHFGFTEFLQKINTDDIPERTLRDFYHGLIALNHEKSRKKGLSFPEVKIEEVWEVIVMMLARHGYDLKAQNKGDKRELARCVAYYYNFYSLGQGLYDDATDTLEKLQKTNIKLGLLSNAQFYTPLDLTFAIRNQSNDRLDDYKDLFTPELIFLSFEYGVAKPNQILFRRLYDALYELEILPSQTLFVGNDLSQDIQPAAEAGMKTAFFTGDDKSAFMYDLEGKVIPDIIFDAWEDLVDKVSFYRDKNS